MKPLDAAIRDALDKLLIQSKGALDRTDADAIGNILRSLVETVQRSAVTLCIQRINTLHDEHVDCGNEHSGACTEALSQARTDLLKLLPAPPQTREET